ncbi:MULTISPECIES: replication protein RepA [Bifidobacterium]|uniref:Replication protein RepA n=1 Tax=Bifidobacterium fermentum TaxID=3059035 RepID=A0AB39UF57_9BIFI|nr:replication protein RepA [Bifidobacterium aquikefiri]
MTDSTDIEIPNEPWMSHAFISKLMTQVSLPYRKPKNGIKAVVRRNGNLTAKFTATGDCLPYGKYPRLFEMYACTMVKSGDPSFDPEKRTLNLGTTFREFLRLLNIEVGGRQLKTIKPQLDNLFRCAYTISNDTASTSDGVAFTVATKWQIDWLRNEPQEHGLFENWVRFSQEYIDYLRDSPVPVDLSIVARLNSPMSLDVYWWLTRRYSYLHERQSITWQQLYNQFGSTNVMPAFKQSFQRAVDDVHYVYPQANITCGRNYVTLFPSQTAVPTTAQTRSTELLAKQSRERSEKASAEKSKREVSEGDIGRVLESIEYGDDFLAARRHVVHGLTAGYAGQRIIDAWNEGTFF